MTALAFPIGVDSVARKLGISTPTTPQRERIEDALLDAIAVVEDALNRPLIPERKVAVLSPHGGDLSSATAWPIDEDDDVTIETYVAADDGTYTVTYLVGIALTDKHSIARFVRAQAAEDLTHDPVVQLGKRVVSKLTAEGQSISYDARATREGEVGAKPTLTSLRRYRRYSVLRKPGRIIPPWPLTGNPVGWDTR